MIGMNNQNLMDAKFSLIERSVFVLKYSFKIVFIDGMYHFFSRTFRQRY